MEFPLLPEAEEMVVTAGSPKSEVEDGVGKPPYGSNAVEEEEPLSSAVDVKYPVPVGPTGAVELAVTGYGMPVERADDEAVAPLLSSVDEVKTAVPVGPTTKVELLENGYGIPGRVITEVGDEVV